ncbi:NapC/NirT family cytochrome c [Terasakiella sp. SH-1]|uniref:NapC/NirT family cytochrome c n=1 Tax=Terasakiella sp. SH-1 TaxID=2560057 RepID=UPI0010733DBB|nr:NapC/NirT family cytochrome c [Terasakiella sp. SH-1]
MSELKEKGGLFNRIWALLNRPSKKTSAGKLLLVGLVAGIVFWGGFNWSLELTNTESFCISCHEMEQNPYREYVGTVHDANASGVRATCPDCHVPRPWIYKIQRKIQASNELWHKMLGTIDTREKYEDQRLKMATREWKRMKASDSRECRNCHNFMSMDVSKQNRRARNRHLEAQEDGKTCIDCHKGIAHELPAGAFTAEQELENAH